MSDLATCPVLFETLYRPAGTIDLDTGGAGASLAFHVGTGVGGAATDVIDFLTFVGGTTETVAIGGVAVERIVPLRHPYLPAMVATRARAEGTGLPVNGAPGWSNWKVSVDFATPLYEFGGDTPYSVLNHRVGASAITLPGRAYAVSGTPLDHDVAISIPEILFSLTLFQVPTVNIAVYAGLVGKVNNATLLGMAAETVRFDGLESQQSQTIGGVTTKSVTLSFAFRPRSWNQVLLPTGVWGTPLNISDSSKLHVPTDLTPALY